MKCYVEITLLPDVEADISLNFLWQKVYQLLHLKFVEMKNESTSPPPPFKGGRLQPIGVSFPKYDVKENTLGNQIRLFAQDSELLERFNARQLLQKLADYVHVTGIRNVPPKIEYGCFQRLQLKTSDLRLARRKAKRENADIEVILSTFQRVKEQKKPPFVVIKSASNGEIFCLFVVYNKQANDNYAEGFGTYGLSNTSTVPIF